MVTILPKRLVDWIEDCIRAGGIPQLVEKYGPRDFLAEGYVLVRCWGAGDKVPGGLIKLTPEELEVVRKYAKERGAAMKVYEELKRLTYY